MPGYIIHIAVANEYIRKNVNEKENIKEFINGSIYPDLVKPKSKSHYGKSPAYTNLKMFLENNNIDNSFQKGQFLHLITDYLFYNYYLIKFCKEEIYNDYDILNKQLIEKYKIDYIPKEAKEVISFKNGNTKILDMNLACKIIDEVSNLDIKKISKEVMNDKEKWNIYKGLV